MTLRGGFDRCDIRGWCLQVVFLGEEGLDAGGVRKVSDSVSTLYVHAQRFNQILIKSFMIQMTCGLGLSRIEQYPMFYLCH